MRTARLLMLLAVLLTLAVAAGSAHSADIGPTGLHGFLLNPPPIRPESYMVLRMPKFNMSEEEA